MLKFLHSTFWNDDDGFSAKDFLMVLFGGLYALFLVVTFFTPFFGVVVSAVSTGVISSMGAVVMTIVGGVFAVQTVREFKTPIETINNNASVYEEPVVFKKEENEGTDTTRI